MRSRVTDLVLLALLVATSALAQQGTTEVRGRVLDSQGAVLPGVTVIVRNQDNGMFREAVSADEGIYFISGLVPGVYEITAELQGFKKYARRDVRLEIGKTATVDVPLQVGSVAETITVTAEAPLVDVTSKEVGGNIGSNELIELPSINRNFIGFIGLLPGIVPSISTESFGSDSVSVNGSDRGTTTTCSTAATTTTTSSGSAPARRPGPRSSRCRSSRSSPTSSTRSSAGPPARSSTR